MVQRAVEIRGQPVTAWLLPFGQSSNAAPYVVSDSDRAREKRCVEPYRSDRIRGRGRQAAVSRRALGPIPVSSGHRHVAITVALNRVVARPVRTM